MRIIGLLSALLGLACGGWVRFIFLARNAYFRPVSNFEASGTDSENNAYFLALEAGEKLATDLYYPAMICAGALVTLGIFLFLKKQKTTKIESASDGDK